MLNLLRQFTINRWQVKAKSVRFGFMSRVGDGTTFEGNNRIGRMSLVWGKVGRYSYLGDNCIFIGSIGNYTSISSNVHTINGRHAFKAPYVSTCPLFFSAHNVFGDNWIGENLFEEYSYADKEHRSAVIVGNDCWIGYGVSITEGATIGDGAVILANATVTKDVPPYAIVGGIPAKIVGYRYDESTIKKLLTIKWWNQDVNWLRDNVRLFCDIDKFLTSF